MLAQRAFEGNAHWIGQETKSVKYIKQDDDDDVCEIRSTSSSACLLIDYEWYGKEKKGKAWCWALNCLMICKRFEIFDPNSNQRFLRFIFLLHHLLLVYFPPPCKSWRPVMPMKPVDKIRKRTRWGTLSQTQTQTHVTTSKKSMHFGGECTIITCSKGLWNRYNKAWQRANRSNLNCLKLNSIYHILMGKNCFFCFFTKSLSFEAITGAMCGKGWLNCWEKRKRRKLNKSCCANCVFFFSESIPLTS